MNTLPAMQVTRWNIGQLIAFRFITILFVMFVLLNPNVVALLLYPLTLIMKVPVNWLTSLTARVVFHIDEPLRDQITGSGDRQIDYIHLFLAFWIAVVGTVIWTVADYRRRSYTQALYWLTVVLRYYLALTMIQYGMIKLCKLQFPDLTEGRLSQTYGNSSPMGLAWRFLSFSAGYNYFMGFAEISGALLLLFRRTVTLGAILTLFVSLNVMAINYCFDVPVKILSTALVAMSFFLMALDAKPLINFFILRKPTGPPATLTPAYRYRWMQVTSLVLKCLLLLLVMFMAIINTVQYVYAKNNKAEVRTGLYNVVSYREPGTPKAKTDIDPIRWQKVTLTPDSLSVYIAGGVRFAWACNVNAIGHQLICFKPNQRETECVFKYKNLKTGNLSMKGDFRGHHMVARLALLSAYKADTTLLMNRGFHWVNEVPFNR